MDNWVLKRAILTPERTAVYDGETRYTFGEVFDEAQRLGAVLDRFGAFKTQNVAMVSNNNVRGYLLAVTLLLYGKTVVWLNKRLTNDELAGQMRDAGAACCLKDDSLPENLLGGIRVNSSNKKAAHLTKSVGDADVSGDDGFRIVGFDEIFAKADDFKLGGTGTDLAGSQKTSRNPVSVYRSFASEPASSSPSEVSAVKNSFSDNGVDPIVSAPSIPREFDDDQVVSIMFTSGSTGAPKGIQQTVRNHFTSATSVALNLGTSPTDEWLCAVPIFHISGYSIILRGLIFDVAVRLMDHFEASEMERILTNEPISWVSVVPTMLKELVPEHEKRIAVVAGSADGSNPGLPDSSSGSGVSATGTGSDISSDSDAPVPLPANFGYSPAFKGFILGGEKSDLKLLKRCHALGMIVVRSYGMTETCSQIVGTSTGDGARKLLASGKPYFTTSLKLADETDEILIKTDALTPGYLNRPGIFEAKKTADGWYRTGDVGHIDDDGYLYVDGRLDNMMISGGEHVFPEEVERVYAECPGIDGIAVTAEPDEKWGEVPVAYVVCKEAGTGTSQGVGAGTGSGAGAGTGKPPASRQGKPKGSKMEVSASLTAQWREFGRGNLAHYKVPKRFYRVDSLPCTSTGKVRRFLLGKS
ncbi:AMP-binding protein [Bifidobacterium sp. ESL0769]|uniref:AMP-binding protein n=1 Tax=Bifidobacterium sp. ESL0769 TaxID=2983229 RepID=UPI0023F7424C|nr:AMP-binding protein [Bifidobacterium sp. ESL0769]WEV67345.1 AMP-binding protein [Bifidobacterium sp. ESL0769]